MRKFGDIVQNIAIAKDRAPVMPEIYGRVK